MVAVLYVLGIFLKRVPNLPSWTIPFILTGLGIILGILILGVPQGILQGILSAGGAVLVDQMIKQVNQARGIDADEI